MTGSNFVTAIQNFKDLPFDCESSSESFSEINDEFTISRNNSDGAFTSSRSGSEGAFTALIPSAGNDFTTSIELVPTKAELSPKNN